MASTSREAQSAQLAVSSSAGVERVATLHFLECGIEALLLAAFMASACGFTLLLEHPDSSVHAAISQSWLRRVLIGVAMGLTALLLIRSRLGQRSGAHMNPAVTLVFLRLGKITPRDAAGYIVAQFCGGLAGVGACALAFGSALVHPSVVFAATLPGSAGVRGAFAAECLISAGMICTVLLVSNHPRLCSFTPWFAALLIFLYIAVEAPLSGMSMNPARSLASAVFAQKFDGIWLYFVAPILGMLLGCELYLRASSSPAVHCAKLLHPVSGACLFRCRFERLLRSHPGSK